MSGISNATGHTSIKQLLIKSIFLEVIFNQVFLSYYFFHFKRLNTRDQKLWDATPTSASNVYFLCFGRPERNFPSTIMNLEEHQTAEKWGTMCMLTIAALLLVFLRYECYRLGSTRTSTDCANHDTSIWCPTYRAFFQPVKNCSWHRNELKSPSLSSPPIHTKRWNTSFLENQENLITE